MPLAQWGHFLAQFRAKRRRDLEGSAMICATLANINRDESKKPTPFKTEDFLPEDPDAEPEDLDKKIEDRMMMLVQLTSTPKDQVITVKAETDGSC